MIDAISQDLRLATRLLKKQWVFSLVMILTLALGVGPLTLIFGAIDAARFASLPYKSAERLVILEARSVGNAVKHERLSYPDLADLRGSSRTLDNIAAYSPAVVALTGRSEPERLPASMVSLNCFSTLGANPILGRDFSGADQDLHVAILGYGLWKRVFGSSPAVLGQVVILNDMSFRIIGVMPPGFHLPFQNEDLWVPLAPNPALSRARGSHWLYAIGRMKTGVGAEQVQAELEIVSRQLQKQYPTIDEGWAFQSVVLRDAMTRDIQPTLLLLFAAGLLLLAVSCVNAGNLLLARSANRESEIATRAALGASRSRLVRQMLVEAFLLAALAGAAGVGLGAAGIRIGNTFVSQVLTGIPTIRMDARVLGFAVFVSLLTVLVSGLIPALRATGGNLAGALNRSARTSTGGVRQRRLWNSLIIVEVVICFVVLIGASLLIRTVIRLNDVDLGFATENILTAQLSLPFAKYGGGTAETTKYREIIENISALRGIESAGAMGEIPVGGSPDTVAIEFPGSPSARENEEPRAERNVVTADVLRALGVPLLAGRSISERDTAETPNVALVNQTFARRYWPLGSPVGRHFSSQDVCSLPQPCEIIGVVGDTRSVGLQFDPAPAFYVPLNQNWWGTMTLVIRTSSAPLAMLPRIRNAVWSVDKNLPLARVRTMEEIVSSSIVARRLSALILSLIAALALILSTVGIYGAISFTVSRRIRELGIRMALGATAGDVGSFIVFQGLRLAATGVFIGILSALFVMRLLTSFLFGVSPADPLSFLLASSVLLVAAFMASYLPARKALKLDIVSALRAE
jgi:putative ABC transport system permease protein